MKKEIKISLWQKFKGWLIIKPLLRNESISNLKDIAEGLPDKKMKVKYKIIQHFAKEILEEIKP